MSIERRAFSLPEVLVVIGIVGMLVGIVLPSIVRAREQATAVECRAKLQQIGHHIVIYANQNRGHLPNESHARFPRPWPEILFGEGVSSEVVCPTGRDLGEVRTYMMNSWLLVFRTKLGDRIRDRASGEVVLLGENKPGRNYDRSVLGSGVPHLSYDPVRHGRTLRSNYLWADLHVSNEEPYRRPGERDPWMALPAR